MDTNHEPHAGDAVLRTYDAARTAYIDSLRAEPQMDRKQVEAGLADLVDTLGGLFSIEQMRMTGSTALVISELAKAGRWLEVQFEIDGFYCDQIAEAESPLGQAIARGAA